MRKNIAVILGNLFDYDSKRGSYFYIIQFIYSLMLKNDVDIYCEKNFENIFPGAKNVFYIKRNEHVSAELLENRKYDFVWNISNCRYKNRKFISFDVRHSHSLLYRMKFVRSKLELLLKKIFTPKRCYSNFEIYCYKKGFMLNDILFANSQIAKNDYVNLVEADEKKVFVIYPIISPIKEEDTCPIKNKIFTFGLNAISFNLKGGFIFLNSLFWLKCKHQKFKARIIYPKYNKNLIAKLVVLFLGLRQDVEFLALQSNMKDFYNSIDCLVVPSKEDTFSLTALEAMTYKLPVIVSNMAGVSEIIEDGKNGFIFDIKRNPVKHLTDSLFKILNHKNLSEIRQNAYKTAKDNSLENHSEKLNEILDNLIEERKTKQ